MQLLRAVIKCNLHIKKPPKMFKVFLLFFLRFISHSFLFFDFDFPSMKRVFLAFLVHKTVCNLPSKDFHMQTARGEEGLGGIPFDFVFVS